MGRKHYLLHELIPAPLGMHLDYTQHKTEPLGEPLDKPSRKRRRKAAADSSGNPDPF
jgi:hypothetical protein